MSAGNSSKYQGPSRRQSGERLITAAQSSAQVAAGIDKPAQPKGASQPLLDQVLAAGAAARYEPPSSSCKFTVKIAIFFDGTGNNMGADLPTLEHSNVARLYRAHVKDDHGVHRRYVAGLGTYFKQIGDPGDRLGMAVARRGEQRLEWAMRQIDEILQGYRASDVLLVRFSLFGFSRGAALARAFALRLQDRCEAAGAGWRWKPLGCEAQLYFMGLFDTVASVGAPASSNLPTLSGGVSTNQVQLDHALNARRVDANSGLAPVSSMGTMLHGIALGKEPGADPSPGPIDGHMVWASDLRLPPMLLKCVHYTAGHEIRNSFPLDSTREGHRLPIGIAVDERVYPGVHSDVGGGYRPGEGGKSIAQADLISLVPLNQMLFEARAAGVPLSEPVPDDFRMSPKMVKLWHAYMSHPTLTGSRSTEAWMLAHMRLYYAWRFKMIRRSLPSGARPNAAELAALEKGYRAEEAELDKQIARAEADPQRQAALAEQQAAQRELMDAEKARNSAMLRAMPPKEHAAVMARHKAAERRKAAADARMADADDERLKLTARKSTLPGSGLAASMSVYDRHLLLDVQAILERRQRFPRDPLRPHYVRMIEAYEAEFVRNQGLLDGHPEALALFEHHVHNSLAAFALDVTLPSDPRIVYVGRDQKSEFAAAPGAGVEATAA